MFGSASLLFGGVCVFALGFGAGSAPPPGDGPATEVGAPDAQAPDAREADVRRLLQLSGASDAMFAAAETNLAAERAAHPEIPEAFWVGLRAELTPAVMEELLIPVYERHFSAEEIGLLLLALDNPAVRKLISEQGALAAEATAAGEVWGHAAARRVQASLLPPPVGTPR